MSESAVLVEAVGYTFAGREQPSLEDVSFELRPGSWTLLSGASGAGKSTLLRALAGWIPRHASGRFSGRVVVAGCDTREMLPPGWIGLLGQSPDEQFCTTTVLAEIAFGLEQQALPVAEIERRCWHALHDAGLVHLTARRLDTLSGGEKQRVLLAAVMALQPRLLLLDEPLAQLDPVACETLLERVDRARRSGCTVVMIEHRLDLVAPWVERTLHLERGRLVENRPAPIRLPRSSSPARHTTGAPILRMNDLCVRHAGAESDVLREISFVVRSGERLAIVGPNGGGKSTLLATLIGLYKPRSGSIAWSEPEFGSSDVALVPQQPEGSLFTERVRDELAWGPRVRGVDREIVESRVRGVAAALGFSAELDAPPQALSQGERLRVALAAQRTLDPQLLLLDEPTTGQDADHVQAVFDDLRRYTDHGPQRPAVIFATHDLSIVRREATRVIVLSGGRVLAEGAPHEVLDDEALLLAAGLRCASGHASPPFVTPSEIVESPGLDPRVKLAWLATISTLCVLLDTPGALVTLLCLSAAPLIFVRLAKPAWLALLGGAALVAWSTMLAQMLFYAGPERTVLFEIAGIVFYREGAWYGLLQSSRFIAGFGSGIAVCVSTRPERLLAGLRTLGVPSSLTFITLTALEFLPSLVRQGIVSSTARRLRRGRPAWFGFDTLAVLGPLTATTIRRATHLAVSVTTRGFRPGGKATTFPPLRWRTRDHLLISALALGVMLIAGAKTLVWLGPAWELESVVGRAWLEWLAQTL